MTEKKTNEEISIIKTASCPSLSGRSELTYQIGHKDKTFFLKVKENTGSGHFCNHYILLKSILDRLETQTGLFSLNVFKDLYEGQSINNLGFLGAILKHETIILSERRKYKVNNTKAFISALEKLSKTPAKKKPSRKKAAKTTDTIKGNP